MNKQERPIDNRIPDHWRNGFKEFTGLEPTFEEYQNNPLMWSDRTLTNKELIKGTMIFLFLLGSIVFYFYLLGNTK